MDACRLLPNGLALLGCATLAILVLFPFACGFLILVLLRGSAVFNRLRMLSCSMLCSHILHGCCCLGAALVYTISMFPRLLLLLSWFTYQWVVCSPAALRPFVVSSVLAPSIFPVCTGTARLGKPFVVCFPFVFSLPLVCCVLVKLVVVVLLSSSGVLPTSST
jgi:hypothetical protein